MGDKVYAYVREEHHRSRRVLEKAGFKRLEARVEDEISVECLLYRFST